jgi:hypothetical protein
LRRRERALSAFCCAPRREARFELRALREEEMRERESLSGAMWNWFVVSEMSCSGGVSLLVRTGFGGWVGVSVGVLLQGLRRRGPFFRTRICDVGVGEAITRVYVRFLALSIYG